MIEYTLLLTSFLEVSPDSYDASYPDGAFFLWCSQSGLLSLNFHLHTYPSIKILLIIVQKSAQSKKKSAQMPFFSMQPFQAHPVREAKLGHECGLCTHTRLVSNSGSATCQLCDIEQIIAQILNFFLGKM